MKIGKLSNGKGDVCIDLEKLISSRLLIQANSGGGKSWVLRKILEESHGKVQHIILDLEGEFSTLREKYDYLLVGKDGEIPCNIKTANLLARKLLELNVSTIIDVSELKKHERIIFVKRFLDSLIDSPRNLWHPCLVVVDEAHQFCPQTSKSESASSVIDLMTRGRKRGFGGILATQRLSKLNKDAAAECNNKLIGRTGLDVDRKRASEELGFTSKEDERSLRYLEPGEFYCFGTAISKEIIKTKVGMVKTTHPEPGTALKESSPTPSNIKKILSEFVNLPDEADEELRTKEDMQKKIMSLKRELRVVEKGKPNIQIDERAVERAKTNGFKEAERQYLKQNKDVEKQYLVQLRDREFQLVKLQNFVKDFVAKGASIPNIKLKRVNIRKDDIKKVEEKVVVPKNNNGNSMDVFQVSYSDMTLRAGAMKMLGWLAAAHPDYLSKQRLATLAGFSVKGGTFNTYLSELKREDWVKGNNSLYITSEGLNNTPSIPPLPSGEDLINLWAGKFRAGAGKLLKIICDKYPHSISKEDLGDEANMEFTGGTFNTYLSELRRNNLIQIDNGNIIAAKEFFE